MISVKTFSEWETLEFGSDLASRLPPKSTVLLIGNLGAGKTVLAKGILSGLGVATPDEVTSPTYTLIHEYGNGRAYHLDLYRLDTAAEVEALGLEELLERNAIIIIEWGERFPQLIPQDRVEIRIDADIQETRIISVFGLPD
ncbi:MAG: tRNA (adenosine(37)-N6)-threonylcarbamoyltransferase complex ATPase subunit type 1 TsaE [Acidobacteriota bacterium]